MKILVVGGGGREHAIIWKLKNDDPTLQIHCCPGNGGISQIATCVDIDTTELADIVEYSCQQEMDLVFVAPDDPLAMGLVDMLNTMGIRAFGPTKLAAQLESSKVFAKNLMKKYGIPTAEYAVFNEYKAAFEYIKAAKTYPLVVKADGLALGKGVIICENAAQAHDALRQIMCDKAFGKAGNQVVIEEFIEGPEVSILAFCDGKTLKPMISAQDHKRIFDGDKGGNTGGMGTFAPSPKYTKEVADYCEEHIFKKTLSALNAEGIEFKGVIYFGLMLTKDGVKVLEYNARFGDPETQVILPLLKTPLLSILNAVIDSTLEGITIEWEESSCVCVVMASKGYPGRYVKGDEIFGLSDVASTAFHAGTKLIDGKYYTHGGRVLGLCAKGSDIHSAREAVYADIGKISFEGAQYRTDIGIK